MPPKKKAKSVTDVESNIGAAEQSAKGATADKNQEEPKTEEQEWAEFFKETSKRYGAGTIGFANELDFINLERVSTGVLGLDLGTGGGLPLGRISEVYGLKSSGKSTMLLRSAGNAQRTCRNCITKIRRSTDGKFLCKCGNPVGMRIAWLDVEQVWDAKWAAHFVDESRIILVRPVTGEDAVDFICDMFRTGKIDIAVLDSIAFLEPLQELQKSATESTVGLQPRLVGSGMRKFVSLIADVGFKTGHRPTLWATNQIRMKVTMFGNPEVLPGGMAQGFATSVEVRLRPKDYRMDSESGRPINVLTEFKIEKNKTGSANMEGQFRTVLMKTAYKNVGDIYDEPWAILMGEKVGMIDVGKKRVTYRGVDHEGKEAFETYLLQHPDVYEEFKDELLPKLLAD